MNELGNFLADSIPPHTFWNDANNSTSLILKAILAVVIVTVAAFVVKDSGPIARRYIVGGSTFIAGAFYVAYFLWPQPVHRQPNEMPLDLKEHISFWFDDALPIVSNISNILSAFLLCLGVVSVVSVHGKKVLKRQRDWGFSIVLLACVVVMVIVGYLDWMTKNNPPDWLIAIVPTGSKLALPENWGFINYAQDFLFNQLLQQMDAAMFSIIAFFIMSAAYRAFRIRSVEASILLASALIVMLALMGAVEYEYNRAATAMLGTSTPFTLTEIAKWLRDCFQTPSIRAIDLGVGLGTLAMGLRLWLSLEKQGAS